jgi:hypothetical protein
MTFAPPTLAHGPEHPPASATVSLASLGDDLILKVPDAPDTPANWDVYPILGSDPDEPEWRGLAEPTGVWNDLLDDMVSLTAIELSIPREALEKYLNRSVELRYKFADESSLEPCSEPLLLTVEA